MPAFPVTASKASCTPTPSPYPRFRAQHSSFQPHSSLSIILDSQAHICFCSPALATLLGASPEKLIGAPAHAVIQDLPLHEATPGYNLAFVTFAAQCGQPRNARVQLAGGVLRSVRVMLHAVKVGREFLLYLDLQHLAAAIQPFASRIATGQLFPSAPKPA